MYTHVYRCIYNIQIYTHIYTYIHTCIYTHKQVEKQTKHRQKTFTHLQVSVQMLFKKTHFWQEKDLRLFRIVTRQECEECDFFSFSCTSHLDFYFIFCWSVGTDIFKVYAGSVHNSSKGVSTMPMKTISKRSNK